MFLLLESELLLDNNIIYFYSSEFNCFSFRDIFDYLSKINSEKIICIDLFNFNSFYKRFSINEVPSIIIFNNGEEVRRVSGISSLKDICDILTSV